MAISHSPLATNSAGVLSLFELLAQSTWDWLGHARRLRMSLSEDTISDITALEIERSPYGISVVQISKKQERYLGFDWMWAIFRSGALSEVYAVQAKKIRIKQPLSYSYPKLKYRTGSWYQIDALQNFSFHLGATPLYCFYNNVDIQSAVSHWNCLEQPDAPQMGCTLVPLHAVRLVHDGPTPRDFHAIHNTAEAIPWRCLFHLKCGLHIKASSNQRSEWDSNLTAYLSRLLSRDEGVVSVDSFIDELELGKLVETYQSGRFLPIPKRIILVQLED